MGLIKILPHQNLRKENLKDNSHGLPVYVLGVYVYFSLFLNTSNFQTNRENQKGYNFILYISSSCIGCSSVVRDNLSSPLVSCSKLILGLSVRDPVLPKLSSLLSHSSITECLQIGTCFPKPLYLVTLLQCIQLHFTPFCFFQGPV